MSEKETGSCPGTPYMSPLVKQGLARLDKDGETRRSAMNSLKQFVEDLDPGSMPRFLAQVSESRDQGSSRSYAISLYEEVARVHGKLIIPHIPRVMATVTRSLSSSGGSPQLHQACAKVVSAVARHSVEEGSPARANEILRQLCDPLLAVLAGKLEPLAAGAAICLQALVESEKWKFASDEIVAEACLKTSVALGEKLTRTVPHMQLARSLVTTNPSFFEKYVVALLRTGTEVLRQNSASGTWQQRVCAARLLQAVLPIVDEETLASEWEHVVRTLDDCKHDRMAHVRSAVSETLKTAKVLSSRHYLFSSDGGTQGRLRQTTSACIPYHSLLGEEMGSEHQSSDIVGSSVATSKFGGVRSFNSLDNAFITAYRRREGVDILVEEVSSNGSTVDIDLETEMDSDQGLPTEESRYNRVGAPHNENLDLMSSSRSSHKKTSSIETNRKRFCEIKRSASDIRNQPVRAHSHNMDDRLHASSGVVVGRDYKDTLDFLSERQSRPSSLLHQQSPADTSFPQKRRPFIAAEDFLPFNTPRRLVNSLQSNLSSPLPSGSPEDKATESLHEGHAPDLESSSEVGWSVRGNPIALDNSRKADGGAEDKEQEGNVRKKSVIDSSRKVGSSEFDAQIVHTAGCGKLSSEIAHASESLSFMGTSTSLERECFAENAEVLNSQKAHNFCGSAVQRQGGSLSSIAEQYPAGCICSGNDPKGIQSFQGERNVTTDVEHKSGINERDRIMPRKVQHFFTNVSSNLLTFGDGIEVVLSGFVLLMLAVPIAMLISNVLRSHLDRPGLIPT